jgi:hypothetical protein
MDTGGHSQKPGEGHFGEAALPESSLRIGLLQLVSVLTPA